MPVAVDTAQLKLLYCCRVLEEEFKWDKLGCEIMAKMIISSYDDNYDYLWSTLRSQLYVIEFSGTAMQSEHWFLLMYKTGPAHSLQFRGIS